MNSNDASERRDRWARLRFAVVGPLLASPPPKGRLRAELERLAERAWDHPSGTGPVRFSASTIERWYYQARAQDSDPVGALRRRPRADAGRPRAMSAALIEALREQYRAHPSWSAQLHHENLAARVEADPALGPMPSYATLTRAMRARGLVRKRRRKWHESEAGPAVEAREVLSWEVSRSHALWHAEMARELSQTHGALSSRWREDGLEGIARAAVLDAADRLGRRLVLMVENMQTLCETVDREFGWQLRGVLQSEPQIMLLASATSRFEALEDAGGPFFELFRIVHLQPLTTEECRRLWTIVSERAPGGHEVRPLEILTGGSPRLLVVLAAFARHQSFRHLMEELVALVDEHTEYFRSHLEVLPKSERRVYVALIDLWQPSSTGEIAARARLDVRVVSTMLGRLIDRGAVTAESDGGSRRRLYAASERLYSIYYKLRRERDEAAVVEALIRFMVAFYDVGKVWRISEQLLHDALESTAILAGLDRAPAGVSSPADPGARIRQGWRCPSPRRPDRIEQ